MNSDKAITIDQLYDVLIVGGGPAGLTAALMLARQQHTAIVFDSGKFRNGRSHHMHNVPTWDHRDPGDFRAAARTDALEHYSTIHYEPVEIGQLTKISDSEFEAVEVTGKADGSQRRKWKGCKVIMAVGVADDYPKVEGYDEVWGKGVYNCLFCHGYEERMGKGVVAHAGVLAIDMCASTPHAIHMAHNARQLVPIVTIYTDANTELADEIHGMLDQQTEGSSKASNSGFKIDIRKVSKLSQGPSGSGVTIHFANGSTVTEAFLGHAPRTHAHNTLVDQLGLERTEQGDLKVSTPFQQTSVSGVFAAGDCQTPFKVVPIAISSGSMVAVGVSAQIQAERYGHQSMV